MLINLIQTIANWKDKSPAQLYSELSSPSVWYEDHQLYSWAGIALIIGDAGASALCRKLIELDKLWAVHQLGGVGLDLANEEIQQQLYYLDSIGVLGMAKLALSVKRKVSLLEQVGIQATTEQISVAKAEALLVEAARDKLRQIEEARMKWDKVAAEIRSRIESGGLEGTQVVTAVNQMWSG